MKSVLIYKIIPVLLLSIVFWGCKKESSTTVRDETPLYQQIGAIPKKYSSLNVTPETLNKALSEDFKQRWETAKAAMLELGGRNLKSFVVKFVSESELDLSVQYQLSADLEAEAIFKYSYVADDAGNISLTYLSASENAETIASALYALKEDYLEKYKFRIDWIDDKLPGSREILAAYYRSDDPASYFYGVIGVRETGKNTVEDAPLYKEVGFDKRFTGINVTPETYTKKISDDFYTKWNTAKEALNNLGGRQLRSFAIRFVNATYLTISFSFSPANSTGILQGTYTCTYDISEQGYLENIVISGRNSNANTIEPALTAILSDYLLKYKFKVDWIENEIPGSRGTVAAYYVADNPSSFFYGDLTFTPLYQEMGYNKKYSSLTVTPEISTDYMSDNFLEIWNAAKTGVSSIGGRQLQSFVLKFTSATQLTITFTFFSSVGTQSTGVLTYNYVLNTEGLLKLTYLSSNANGAIIEPGLKALTEDYLNTFEFKIDWLPGSKTYAAYYRADAPVSYFYGTLGN